MNNGVIIFGFGLVAFLSLILGIIIQGYLSLHHDAMGWVEISVFGQLTPRPQVHVSICSRRGAQGVYTYNDDEQGNAAATLHGTGLARIAGIRLHDRRPNKVGY